MEATGARKSLALQGVSSEDRRQVLLDGRLAEKLPALHPGIARRSGPELLDVGGHHHRFNTLERKAAGFAPIQKRHDRSNIGLARLAVPNLDISTVKNSTKNREAFSPTASIKARTADRPVLVILRGGVLASWTLMEEKWLKGT